ncbi:MAG: glycosyltransferase, partial [Terriglobia bacterium]
MEPKITIDARMLGPSGIGTCLRNLLDQFAVLDHEFCFRVISAHADELLRLPRERFQIVRASAPIYSFSEQWEIARLARGTDLLYIPHYNIPYFYRGKLVVTIHDLTHITCRQFFPGFAAHHYARFMLGAATGHAQRIVTDSQFSRRSIQEHFRVGDGKIRVIYPPPSALVLQPSPTSGLATELGISGDYILYAGALKKHKNLEALVRAYA